MFSSLYKSFLIWGISSSLKKLYSTQLHHFFPEKSNKISFNLTTIVLQYIWQMFYWGMCLVMVLRMFNSLTKKSTCTPLITNLIIIYYHYHIRRASKVMSRISMIKNMLYQCSKEHAIWSIRCDLIWFSDMHLYKWISIYSYFKNFYQFLRQHHQSRYAKNKVLQLYHAKSNPFTMAIYYIY